MNKLEIDGMVFDDLTELGHSHEHGTASVYVNGHVFCKLNSREFSGQFIIKNAKHGGPRSNIASLEKYATEMPCNIVIRTTYSNGKREAPVKVRLVNYIPLSNKIAIALGGRIDKE